MAKFFQFYNELALLLYLSAITTAQDSTQLSQSEDNGLVGWQHNPYQRGTMNILESCILTIIACTWSIHHPNVPEEIPKSRMGRLLSRLKWMGLTILLPEFILAQAVDELLWVLKTWKGLQESLKGPEETPQESSQGGSQKISRDNSQQFLRDLSQENAGPGYRRCWFKMTSKETYNWTREHLYLANMGGLRVKLASDGDGRDRLLPLTSGELVQYMVPNDQPLSALKPSISNAKIQRMIKRDSLAKTVAFLQTSWTILSVLARWHLHRPTSQLEIMTVAFATCAVLTYAIRWEKPQKVELWEEIPNYHKDLRQLYQPYRFFNIMKDPWQKDASQRPRLSHFRNDTLRPFHVNRAFLPWLIFFMIIVGALHLVAWNFSFPSDVERYMWRTASLLSTGVPLLLWILSTLIPLLSVGIADCLMSKRSRELKMQDAQIFTNGCIWVLKHLKEKEPSSNEGPSESVVPDSGGEAQPPQSRKDRIDGIIQKLENCGRDPKNYQNVIGSRFLSEMNDYVEANSRRTAVYISKDFPRNLKELNDTLNKTHHVIVGDIGQEILSTYDDNFDKINIFPHKTRKWRRGHMSHKILAFSMLPMSVFYTVARLIIITIAFSSLRAMPAGVYDTTWTTYLPKLD
ncbi:hypothetical protein F5Y04DRAFT_246708 [Hypomontagnella monticulosa]|nr:hypothetical protein F5Y04DRAFT_246708 [Hypomontagnella monticulosa]